MSIVTNLLSWSFAISLVLGFLLSRIWELVKVCRLDKAKPLPDGKRRSKWRAVSIDPRYFTGLIAVCFLSWSVFTTQENSDSNARNAADARAFAAEVKACQRVLIVAIRDGRVVTAQYNNQSEAQRSALAQLIRTLMMPPLEIARLDGSDPVRQQWMADELSQAQARTDASRPPLPEPDCGS